MIQMWGLAKTTGILTVTSGQETGEVHFESGRAVWAKAGSFLKNEDAIYHVLALEEGKFRFVNTTIIKKNGNLNSSYNEIIMEGMRRLDHLKDEKRSIEDKYGFIPVAREGVAELGDEERAFMSLVDDKRNLEKIFDHCGLGVHKSFEVYKSLTEKGALELRKVRVLVVDDQQMWRTVLSKMLGQEKCFEVVGTAEDGIDALQKLSELKPDVMTLDLEMPKLGGIKTLYWMMSGGYDILLKSQHNIEIEETYRCPVVVISAVAKKMAPETLDALLGGATGYITKPSQVISESIEAQQQRIAKTVLMASQVDLMKSRRIKTEDVGTKKNDSELDGARKLVCVASSTVGGLTSIMQLVPSLPADLDASVFIMIDDLGSIDHTKSFAEFLDRHSRIRVLPADKNMFIKKGTVYITPGSQSVEFGIARAGGVVQSAFKIVTNEDGKGPERPTDDMVISAIACTGFDKRVGVALAGDGTDGKVGFLEMVKRGEKVFAQDTYSSLNPIKPENVANTGVARVVPLAAMVKNIVMEVGKSI